MAERPTAPGEPVTVTIARRVAPGREDVRRLPGGIFVLQLLFNLALQPVVLRVALVAVAVTALMTWLVMPRLARLLQDWLYAPPRRI
jgi:antibiotic biosynthesis monooxygenase (ABM) superfamily enzyme